MTELPARTAAGRQLASIEGWTPGGGPKFEPAQRPRIIKGEPVSNLPEAEAQVITISIKKPISTVNPSFYEQYNLL